MSQNTGVAPTIEIHEAVDIQEKFDVITSSPGLIPIDINEYDNASVPLLHVTTYFLFVISARFFSRNSTFVSCSFCITLSKSSRYSSLLVKYSRSQPVI